MQWKCTADRNNTILLNLSLNFLEKHAGSEVDWYESEEENDEDQRMDQRSSGLLSLIHPGDGGPGEKALLLKDLIEQMDYAGAGSFSIVLLVSLFLGMALSLQLSAELSRIGLKMYTGNIVGISIIREMGPVVTALIFAGRVGSGMASELGSMILGHQVDTLRVFGVNPVKKLVAPRVLSSIIMLPDAHHHRGCRFHSGRIFYCGLCQPSKRHGLLELDPGGF